MNYRILSVALSLLGMSLMPCLAAKKADKKDPIDLNMGIQGDVVSHYLWRGTYLGSMSVQPEVYVNFKGLSISGWWNIGADNWKFENINPEMDLSIGYDHYGFQLDFTHFYYFNNAKFLEGNCDMTDPANAGRSTVEGHIGYHFDDVLEVPIYVDWYTTLWGGDGYMDENDKLKRAYSSYLEVGFDASLPLGVVLACKVGLVPWKSSYTGYEDVWKDSRTVGLQNLQFTASWTLHLKDLYVTPYATVMLNAYGLNKDNVYPSDPFNRHFNWCLGGTICLDHTW